MEKEKLKEKENKKEKKTHTRQYDSYICFGSK